MSLKVLEGLSPVAIGLIVGAAVLVVLAAVLVRIFFFGRMRLKRAVGDLLSRYERSHALLFGADKNYIDRLESIASMNLLYSDEAEKWGKRFKAIRDGRDAESINAVNDLRDLLEQGRYKELREALPEARAKLDDFEKEVATLDKALSEKFEIEEACKMQVYNLKEQLRNIKALFQSKAEDLALVEPSFNTAYRKLEDLLGEANNLIEDAKYNEAKKSMDETVVPVLKALSESMESLPSICISLTSLLPSKINDLDSRYRELVQRGYPLGHVFSSSDPKNLQEQVEKLAERTARFDLAGVKKATDDLLNKLEAINADFDKEISSRSEFEGGYASTYRDFDSVNEAYVDLRQAMPKIREVYLVDETAESNFQALDRAVNDAFATKRQLDTYVHSSSRQPYSVLLSKVKSLVEETAEAKKELDGFSEYLAGLKSATEEASTALKDYYVRLKNAEGCLRAMGCEALTQAWEAPLSNLFSLLDNMHAVLKARPIDVGTLRKLTATLHEEGEGAIRGIDEIDGRRLSAEKAIVIANRNRIGNSEVDGILKQAETFYFAGDYEKARILAEKVADRIDHAR